MDCPEIISGIRNKIPDFSAISAAQNYSDEICIQVKPLAFKDTCLALHKILPSPVMMLFAVDERRKLNKFVINCVFLSVKKSKYNHRYQHSCCCISGICRGDCFL